MDKKRAVSPSQIALTIRDVAVELARAGLQCVEGMSFTFYYYTGEEIRAGGHIVYAGEAGRIEFVADETDPETACYVQQDLDFVSRGELP